MSDALVFHMRNMDCIFRLGEEVERVETARGQAVAMLKSGKRIVSDLLLYSVGRVGRDVRSEPCLGRSDC